MTFSRKALPAGRQLITWPAVVADGWVRRSPDGGAGVTLLPDVLPLEDDPDSGFPNGIQIGYADELLDAFAGFADPLVADAKAAKLVRRWGFLDVCEHGLPRRSTFAPLNFLSLGRLDPALVGSGHPDACDGPWGSDERVTVWRYWAEQALAIDQIAYPLLRKGSADVDLWEPLGRRPPWFPVGDQHWEEIESEAEQLRPIRLALKAQRMTFAAVLQSWLDLTGASRLKVTWTGSSPPIERATPGVLSIERATPGVLAAIGWELVFRAGGGRDWAACSSCGSPTRPTRRAQGNRVFCPTCRRAGKPAAFAQRDWRRRQRAGKEGN